MIGQPAHPIGGDARILRWALDEHEFVNTRCGKRCDVIGREVAKRHGNL
jgi:hypothetical protein